jgi:2-C-methyl-D-erythritol 2,4-cyclodiphosphate synthase
MHLEGHSDGDAVAHAIADALLSAAGLGDLGTFLPAGDPATAGISGADILRRVGNALSGRDAHIVNIDCTLVCDEPPLAGHRAAMETAVADGLGVSREAVSLKPRHAEGLGFAGRGEGVWASAVVLVEVPRSAR